MTLLDHFSLAAARGPARARLAGATPARRRGRAAGRPRVAHRGRGDLALQPDRRARPGPLPAGAGRADGSAGRRAGAGRRPGRGRGGRAVRAGRRAQRPGGAPRARSPSSRRPGVRVCGIATCDAEEIAATLGVCSDASPDAFTVLHDAFLAGGAFVKVPRGVVVERPIVVLHWSEGDGLASFPHTLVVAEDGCRGHGVRPVRLHRHRGRAPPVTSSTRSSSWSSARTRTSATSRCRSTAPARGRSRCNAPTSAAYVVARSRRWSRSAATTRASAASRCSRDRAPSPT